MYYQKYNLQDGLEKFVKYAWIMKSYQDQSEQDLLIPDGYPEIIFVQKGAYQKDFLNQELNSIRIEKSCIVGIQTKSVLAKRINQCHLIGLKLRPIGAYALFGNRLKDLSDKNQPLTKFGVNWLNALDQQLKKITEDEKIMDKLSNSLQEQIESLAYNSKVETAAAYLDTVLSAKGRIHIPELAKQHHLSVRQFQRNFKAFVGVTPKKFLNIIRFKHLYKSCILQENHSSEFLDYGYYDQMHFIKDFRKYLGISPSNSSNPIFLRRNQMAKRNT